MSAGRTRLDPHPHPAASPSLRAHQRLVLPLEPPLPQHVGQAAHQRPARGPGQRGQGMPTAPQCAQRGRRPRHRASAPGGAESGAAAGEGGGAEEDAEASHSGTDGRLFAYMYIYSSREARWTFIGANGSPGWGEVGPAGVARPGEFAGQAVHKGFKRGRRAQGQRRASTGRGAAGGGRGRGPGTAVGRRLPALQVRTPCSLQSCLLLVRTGS